MNEKIKDVLADRFTADVQKISDQMVCYLEDSETRHILDDDFALTFEETKTIQTLLDVYLAMVKGETDGHKQEVLLAKAKA